ncbi:MAG: Maf family protein [Dermatophilaceae bacterium]
MNGGPAPVVAHLVLASASPARRDILRRAGIDPIVVVSNVDEESVAAAALVARNRLPSTEEALLLARTKCEEVASRSLSGAAAADLDLVLVLVLGCDSVFELDGVSYGKPRSSEVAIARWRLMSGRVGVLHTGHWLIALPREARDGASRVRGYGAHGQRLATGGVVSTRVRFAPVTEDEIAAYVATGEPLHCAGGFTIDGIGAAFVEGVDGDPSNVIGLSLHFLRSLLREVDVPWTALRSASHRGADHPGGRDAH